ncbi:hypothetical protein F5Y16DRAFT_63568 [Xylariaceae sp. FL0255]|nr:hypothetical protein F5Y16DRAFT_63568 [Xylariaceae sp. FL0255]
MLPSSGCHSPSPNEASSSDADQATIDPHSASSVSASSNPMLEQPSIAIPIPMGDKEVTFQQFVDAIACNGTDDPSIAITKPTRYNEATIQQVVDAIIARYHGTASDQQAVLMFRFRRPIEAMGKLYAHLEGADPDFLSYFDSKHILAVSSSEMSILAIDFRDPAVSENLPTTYYIMHSPSSGYRSFRDRLSSLSFTDVVAAVVGLVCAAVLLLY